MLSLFIRRCRKVESIDFARLSSLNSAPRVDRFLQDNVRLIEIIGMLYEPLCRTTL